MNKHDSVPQVIIYLVELTQFQFSVKKFISFMLNYCSPFFMLLPLFCPLLTFFLLKFLNGPFFLLILAFFVTTLTTKAQKRFFH